MPADLPSGYTAGTILVPANTPSNLGTLIQAQVDAQASLTATVFNLSADGANAGPLFIGMSKAVSSSAYGRSVAAGSTANYGSGAQSAIQVGRMYVFSTANSTLHIELLP